MVKSKSMTLLVLAAGSMLVSACNTMENHGPPVGMSPEQVAQMPTQSDVMLVKQLHFDEDGNPLAVPALTRTEAKMEAGIEKYCWEQVNTRLRGATGQVIKKAAVGGILMGIFTGIGAHFLGLPGDMVPKYGLFGGASGIGSGAFTGSIMVEQARSVAVSYCQIMLTANLRSTGDYRLKDIVAIPVVGLGSVRPRVNWNAIIPTRQQKCLNEAGMDAQRVKECRDEAIAGSNEPVSPFPTIP